MEKDEALKDFLKTFKVVLKNASIYKPDHAAVDSAIKELQKRIEVLFKFSAPILIGFTPSSLLVENKFWEKETLYEEIARAFHQRKVKAVEIRAGLELEELKKFMAHFYLPAREIIKHGGFKTLLKEEEISHITVEELDYSQLLKSEGEELQDIWAFLLQEALNEDDSQKMAALAESFHRVIGMLDPEEIERSEELGKNFSRFFDYLRAHDQAQFAKCAEALVSMVTRKKNISLETGFERIKGIISGLGEEDLARILHKDIVRADDFDALSLSLFSKLTGSERDKEISSLFQKLVRKEGPSGPLSDLREKLSRLLSDSRSPYISENYQRSLENLLESLSPEKGLVFDQDSLKKNYRILLLSLLEAETQTDAINGIIGELFGVWEEISAENNFEYIMFFHQVLKRKVTVPGTGPEIARIEYLISIFVEGAILNGLDLPQFSYFIRNLDKSALDVNIYLRKIFTHHVVTRHILQAYFKFHSDTLLYFNINLEQQAADMQFIECLIESLREVDLPLSIDVLKNIFQASGAENKIKAIQAMRNFSHCDSDFLLALLKKGPPSLKKEVLAVLANFGAPRSKAMKELFGFSSPFGLRNELLLDNLKIVRELDLRMASGFISPLARRRFFWNKKLRDEARYLLEEWDARKS